MCGIFGVLTTKDRLTLDQERFIKDAAIVDQLRGEDATGLVTVERNGTAEVYKQAVSGADFFYTRVGERSKRGIAMAKCVVGHNRKGTTGGALHDSCHPFSYDHVTGVHNGTIPWAALERLDVTGTVAQVDSAKVYAALDKATKPVDVLSLLHTGSYALSWINHDHHTLNFARNSERPMWFASGTEGLYWASEPGMLCWLMSRYGLQDKDSVLWELPPLHHYSIPITDPKGFTKTKYEIKGVVAARPAYSQYNNRYQQRQSQGWFANDTKMPYRTFRVLSTLKGEFPKCSEVIDAIEDNCKVIRQSDAKVPSWSNVIDVVALCYVENEVWGFMQDQAETDISPVPVKIVSVPTNFNLRSKLPDDTTKVKQFPTLRGEISSIKLYPSGDMVLTVTPNTMWNSDSDVAPGLDTDAATEELLSVWAQEDAKIDEERLTKMWTALSLPDREPRGTIQ